MVLSRTNLIKAQQVGMIWAVCHHIIQMKLGVCGAALLKESVGRTLTSLHKAMSEHNRHNVHVNACIIHAYIIHRERETEWDHLWTEELQCGQCVNCLLKNDCEKCKMCLDQKRVWWTCQEKAMLYDETMQNKVPEICTQR